MQIEGRILRVTEEGPNRCKLCAGDHSAQVCSVNGRYKTSPPQELTNDPLKPFYSALAQEGLTTDEGSSLSSDISSEESDNYETKKP